jgi:FkbM family methyltransferase
VKKLFNSVLMFLESRGIFVARSPEIKYFNQFVSQVVENFLSRSRGVLHIGAYEAEERYLYSRFGLQVMWIEALPDTYEILKSNILGFKNQSAMNIILGDRNLDSVDFNVSNNGQSSSLLKFSEDSGFQGVVTSQVIQAPMRTLDSLEGDIIFSDLDFWVIDVQGAELLVLQGASEAIKHCQTLLVEVSTTQFYQGGVLWNELLKFLENAGFVPLWSPNNISHLNILFVRNNAS